LFEVKPRVFIGVSAKPLYRYPGYAMLDLIISGLIWIGWIIAGSIFGANILHFLFDKLLGVYEYKQQYRIAGSDGFYFLVKEKKSALPSCV
jgi:hypothetical protein